MHNISPKIDFRPNFANYTILKQNFTFFQDDLVCLHSMSGVSAAVLHSLIDNYMSLSSLIEVWIIQQSLISCKHKFLNFLVSRKCEPMVAIFSQTSMLSIT